MNLINKITKKLMMELGDIKDDKKDLLKKYSTVIKKLKKKHTFFSQQPPSNSDKIKHALLKNKIEFQEIKLDINKFNEWYQRIDYIKNYPVYVTEFAEGPVLTKKAMQHFFSFELLDINNSDIYMDVASSNSVVPDILKEFHGLNKCWRQDIRYPLGINNDTIGSNATNIPLPDNSISKIALHCSLEHFEEEDDLGFIKEAGRLLKTGGKLCIIPFYLSEVYYIMTSMDGWENRGGIPSIPENASIWMAEEHKQRYSRHYDVQTFKDIFLPVIKESGFKMELIRFSNAPEFNGAPQYVLLLTKS